MNKISIKNKKSIKTDHDILIELVNAVNKVADEIKEIKDFIVL
ncbi:MAG: hypothetical protein AAB706_01485 [Patescibacteria group bacterium]